MSLDDIEIRGGDEEENEEEFEEFDDFDEDELFEEGDESDDDDFGDDDDLIEDDDEESDDSDDDDYEEEEFELEVLEEGVIDETTGQDEESQPSAAPVEEPHHDDEGGGAAPDAAPGDDRFEFRFAYDGTSGLESAAGKNELSLFGNRFGAAKVNLRGRVRDPLLLRDALASLYAVIKSDLRYVPKDRTAYLAYQTMRKQSAGQAAFEARQAYFDWLERNDPDAWLILDPIISVFPDRVLFEVFSKDEGVYATLALDHDVFDIEGEPVFGTTNIDFTDSLMEGVERLRAYRETSLAIAPDRVGMATRESETRKSETVEKKVQVPASWLRGMLQIQSAGVLVRDRCKIAPIDMYNILRQLRLNADKKGQGRAMRLELVPGEYPRVVLEPWEVVIETSAEIYRGSRSEMIRVWGRRRLKLLETMLPRATEIKIAFMGSGLPAFFVLRGPGVEYSLALTGFTAQNWSRTVSFDFLLPRPDEPPPEQGAVREYLGMHWKGTLDEIASTMNIEPAKALAALQSGCRDGEFMFDLTHFRRRPLSETPLDRERLRFRNLRERQAHDLLEKPGGITLAKENRIHGTGVELTAAVKLADFEVQPKLVVDDEGRARRADCTCAFYRKHQLKQGPCEHLIALRILFSRLEREREDPANRARLRTETRTYSRRTNEGESVYQLSLEERRLRIRRGLRGSGLRAQQLIFNSVDDARTAYLARITGLERKGYLDTTR